MEWEQYKKNLEHRLEQYMREYDFLMEYTDELKKLYSQVVSDPAPGGIIASMKARVAQINFFESGGDIPEKYVGTGLFKIYCSSQILGDGNTINEFIPKGNFDMSIEVLL